MVRLTPRGLESRLTHASAGESVGGGRGAGERLPGGDAGGAERRRTSLQPYNIDSLTPIEEKALSSLLKKARRGVNGSRKELLILYHLQVTYYSLESITKGRIEGNRLCRNCFHETGLNANFS